MRRLLTDFEILQTLIDKICNSTDDELINDITKHEIPSRFGEVVNLIAKYKDRSFQSLSSAEMKETNYIFTEVKLIHRQTTFLMLANKLSKGVSPSDVIASVINIQNICSSLNTKEEYKTEFGVAEIEFPSQHTLFNKRFLKDIQLLRAVFDPKCIFPSQNLTLKTSESFPTTCSTVCTGLSINKHCDLSEEQLTSIFQNMKHLIGSLTVIETKYTSGRFLAGLESIECYEENIMWFMNNKMKELGLLNLTSIACSSFQISMNMKTLNMPNLKTMESTNPNNSKVEVYIQSESTDFCMTIHEVKMFMDIETADVDHLFSKYCKPDITETLCKKAAEGCVEIYGNVEIGPYTDVAVMKDVEVIYGSLTIKETKLKNFDFLKKLKYIAQMQYKPAISVQDNPNLVNITFPVLKRIRSETTESVVFKRNNNSTMSFCFELRQALELTEWAPTFDDLSCGELEYE
uniref:Recep_L_domain domain-containing protein n=2 Tax=Caenorhabditis tropicalis TaxID=1561998 RepID=A0A1I7TY47_9PELO